MVRTTQFNEDKTGEHSAEWRGRGENPVEIFTVRKPTFDGQLKSAFRRFEGDSRASTKVEDNLVISDEIRLVTWQDGKDLKIEILSHPDYELSVVSVYPAFLRLDKHMEGFKRIELQVPA